MTTPPATLTVWSHEPLTTEVKRVVKQVRQLPDVHHIAIMPDVHLGHGVCIGTVLATNQTIYPQAVGSDIGCGIATIPLNVSDELLKDSQAAARLLQRLAELVPIHKHPKRQAWPETFEKSLIDRPFESAKLSRVVSQDAAVQLGTLGRGNHFLEVQADESDRLWVMVHSGSRAIGQAVTQHYVPEKHLNRGGPLFGISDDSPTGLAYLNDYQLARQYAAENRMAMLRAFEAIMQREFSVSVDWSELIHTDHDHVERETHFGQEFWIHRKGAQFAAQGISGLIPGSMGSASYHTVGRGCPESLTSCSHGAGRLLSRDAARRSVSTKKLEQQVEPVWFDHRRSYQLCEEAPAAYKPIEAVMRAQRDLVKVTRQLRPVLSYKGT